MSNFVRKGDKKISAPPDFGQPWYRPEMPNNMGRFAKIKEVHKDVKTYDIETILQVREDFESYVKPLNIVKIWRRKTRNAIVYHIEDIRTVGDEDESWILPIEVVKIQRRKAMETVIVEEGDHE